MEAGWRVKVVAKPTGRQHEIELYGMEFIPLPISPTRIDLAGEMRLMRYLISLYKANPDAVVHHVGMKLIFVGNIAANLSGCLRGVVNAVSGLGIFFQNPKGLPQRMLLKAMRVFKPRVKIKTIFQNNDDESLFRSAGLLRPEESEFIKGSGVDLDQFSCDEEAPSRRKVVVFTGRLLRSKGVADFVMAAEKLRDRWEGKAEFWICGDLSANANGIKASELQSMTDNNYIKWLGYRQDIPEVLRQSSVMAFPSYYREGVPRSLLEASAAGLPIVTCDSVGCRDTVENGLNGFLVTPRKPEELALRIDTLLSNPELCRAMGRESRRKAEREYDVNNVVKRHLEIYESVWN